jgi:hypothetical protein
MSEINVAKEVAKLEELEKERPQPENLPSDTMAFEEHLAAQLYTCYCMAVGGKAFNDQPLPDWKEFRHDASKKLQSDAWVEVARRAISEIRR